MNDRILIRFALAIALLGPLVPYEEGRFNILPLFLGVGFAIAGIKLWIVDITNKNVWKNHYHNKGEKNEWFNSC